MILKEENLENKKEIFNMEKEVAAALESVIPRGALGPFLSLNQTEKVTQLIELANLVIGIRLFNKEIGKGGATLSQLSELVDVEVKNLPEFIQLQSREVKDLCEVYCEYLDETSGKEGEHKESE